MKQDPLESRMAELGMPVCKGYKLDALGRPVKCRHHFTQVTFIEHRRNGYCSKECAETKKRK